MPELIEFVIQHLMKGLPITIDLPDLACSTFNATTSEGDAIFGRNFDLSYSPSMLVRTDPRTATASISMVNLGFLGYGEDKASPIRPPRASRRSLHPTRRSTA